MSKRPKVRKLPAGVKLGQVHLDAQHAPAAGAHGRDAGSYADMAARQAYYRECMERYTDFFGLAEIQLSIDHHTKTLLAHHRELEARARLLDMMQLENYRWQIAPSVAIRAAKALEAAVALRVQTKYEVHDAAVRAVHLKFDGPKSHDTAVTEEFALMVAPRAQDVPQAEPEPTPQAEPGRPSEPPMAPEDLARTHEALHRAQSEDPVFELATP
ncbi:MAG: hypothetical protein IPK87_11565 [Planctomycetes bacterium]|nr:hypothetical protein [Planctomycetota bacterium]